MIDISLSTAVTYDITLSRCYCVGCAERVGSAHFAAPETILEQLYSRAADVWSAGVLLFLLLCGHRPFDGPHDQICQSICQGAFNVRTLACESSSAAANGVRTNFGVG